MNKYPAWKKRAAQEVIWTFGKCCDTFLWKINRLAYLVVLYHSHNTYNTYVTKKNLLSVKYTYVSAAVDLLCFVLSEKRILKRHLGKVLLLFSRLTYHLFSKVHLPARGFINSAFSFVVYSECVPETLNHQAFTSQTTRETHCYLQKWISYVPFRKYLIHLIIPKVIPGSLFVLFS